MSADELLRDAIDLHCHVDLEFSEKLFRKPEPEWVWLPRAERFGMRGLVLKSHWWPTVHAVAYLRSLRPSTVTLWSSITLNAVAGGPELWAVDTAAQLGASVVFLPTWNAGQDLRVGGFSVRIREAIPTFDPERLPRYRFVDDAGALTAAARELLVFCRDRALTLATGHVSWAESLAFAEAAKALGYERLIFSHPLSGSVGAPLHAARRAATLGAWIELCGTNLAPGRVTPEEALAWCRAVGVERVVLSTDSFRSENPPPPEYLRDIIGRLLASGLSSDEIRRMVAVNPARALGLE